MCTKGWLRLEADDDRRSHLIEVTDKRQALLRKCLPAWRRAQEDVTGRLGAESVAALNSAHIQILLRSTMSNIEANGETDSRMA
jgi:DNA-binding MarR family transcriptional regulator